MKTKAKLVLGLSLLTAATLTAGATGTFAWFTTNRKATATFNHITAKSVEGSLTITMGTLTEKTPQANGNLVAGSGTTASTEATLTGTTSAMADVSSQDGISFAHPNWTDKAGNDQPVKGIADVSSLDNYGKKGYWTAYYIGLYNGGGSKADVYLNIGSAVSAADNADTAQKGKNDAAAKWTRVAINISGTASQGVTTSAPNTMPNSANGTVVIQGSEAGDKYVAANKDATTCPAKDVDKAAWKDLVDVPTQATGYEKQKITTIAAGYTQYFTVSVWLEGTANNNQDSAIGGVVNVVLNFAALTAADA